MITPVSSMQGHMHDGEYFSFRPTFPMEAEKNQGSKGFLERLQVVHLMISHHTHNMWETNCDMQTWCRSLT